jgi:hypothetical protein
VKRSSTFNEYWWGARNLSGKSRWLARPDLVNILHAQNGGRFPLDKDRKFHSLCPVIVGDISKLKYFPTPVSDSHHEAETLPLTFQFVMEAYDSEREMGPRSIVLREMGDHLPVLIDFIALLGKRKGIFDASRPPSHVHEA